jgi:hypothetical protein
MSQPAPVSLGAEATDYLRVDAYLDSFLHARALKTAFELRLIDALPQSPPAPRGEWAQRLGADAAGFSFLCDLLAGSGVLVDGPRGLALHEDFAAALRYRDLLEAKLDFCGVVLADMAEHFTTLVTAPERFMQQSRTFSLFDYGRCFEASPENERRTRAWMRLTSTLTRQETAACAELHDFSAHRRLLDVGGNSGEFAAGLCERHPTLQATVLDLPLVCDIGRAQLAGRPAAARVGFVKGDARHDPWPGGHDAISFKSMLHDWPEAQARAFIGKAFAALPPGGTVIVYERGPVDMPGGEPSFASLPVLVFFRSYRPSGFYTAALQEAGFVQARALEFRLDTPFFAVFARKPPA